MVLRAPICHVIGAHSRGCPIKGIQFELFVAQYIHVIGYHREFHVGYARFLGFFAMLTVHFSNRMKSTTDIFAQNKFSKDNLNSEICYG